MVYFRTNGSPIFKKMAHILYTRQSGINKQRLFLRTYWLYIEEIILSTLHPLVSRVEYAIGKRSGKKNVRSNVTLKQIFEVAYWWNKVHASLHLPASFLLDYSWRQLESFVILSHHFHRPLTFLRLCPKPLSPSP